jgi:major membrane immunogen (membrane-anchored lipoprotein)
VKAALAGGILALSLFLVACGDGDDGSDVDDPRRREIGGVAQLAVGAYASVGPEALADYMSQGALDQCPKEQLQVALAEEPVPTGFKQLKAVDFNGDGASATITISTRDGEKDINWIYVEEDDNWRISDMPGLGNCG